MAFLSIKNIRLIAISCLFVFLFTFCSTNVQIDDEPVPFEILWGFEGTPGPDNRISRCRLNYSNLDLSSGIDDDLSEIELTINSELDFDKFVICDDSVTVNFDSEFILAGATRVHGSFIDIFDQGLVLRNDTLFYNVSVIEYLNATPGRSQYMVKVLSNDYLEYPVSFNVYWKE